MKHAAALIILVIVAGSPVNGVTCVGLCALDGTCPRVFATSPFVKEEIQVTARASVPASAPYVSVHGAPGEAQLASVPDIVFTGRHRSISALVLRL
jgi:hypothetical protein